MKNNGQLLFFLALFSSQVLALEAVVTVLNAPIHSKAHEKSQIVQYARKGEILLIVDKSVIHSQFIPVWNKLKQVSYVNRKYLKFFLENKKELKQKAIEGVDPTDYRLNEPLPLNKEIPVSPSWLESGGKNSPTIEKFKFL